jgi:hypothetical protein
MRTSPVKALVREVLATLPKPYSEHVIDDVFFSIETVPEWRGVYDSLCMALGKSVVNTWGGYWVANSLGKLGEHQVPSKKSRLIASYSLLDTDAKTVMRKPKEADALQLMSDYYQAHKSELPPDIRKYREAIVDMLMEGATPAEAFAAVRKGAV